MKYLSLLSFLILILGCKEQTVVNPKVEPLLSISANSLLEGDEGNSTVEVNIQLMGDYEGIVSVDYETLTESAFRGLDFVYQKETLEFIAPETEKTISIEIVADTQKEGNEAFIVALSNPVGAEIETSRTTVIIKNDDDQALELPAEGYSTPESYDGFELVWADEFEGETVNQEDWAFDIGNGDNGWGNNELEYYTDRPENVRIENGQLIIEAREENFGGYAYTSTRMKTKINALSNLAELTSAPNYLKGKASGLRFGC